MAKPKDREGLLSETRNAMVTARRKSLALAEIIEQLETAYVHWKVPLDSSDFYVPSKTTWGLEVEDGWEDSAPLPMQGVRRRAIDATIDFRKSIDRITRSLKPIAPFMDGSSQSIDQRWTSRTAKFLRRLRGCVLDGHPDDYASSALPMIRMGIPHSIRESVAILNDRLADVKSASSLPDISSHSHGASGSSVEPKLIRSDDAARRSGLDPNTIRTRAKREDWTVKKAGKFNAYLLENLEQTWPGRNFTTDERRPTRK